MFKMCHCLIYGGNNVNYVDKHQQQLGMLNSDDVRNMKHSDMRRPVRTYVILMPSLKSVWSGGSLSYILLWTLDNRVCGPVAFD